jgi:hypothetical protein
MQSTTRICVPPPHGLLHLDHPPTFQNVYVGTAAPLGVSEYRSQYGQYLLGNSSGVFAGQRATMSAYASIAEVASAAPLVWLAVQGSTPHSRVVVINASHVALHAGVADHRGEASMPYAVDAPMAAAARPMQR